MGYLVSLVLALAFSCFLLLSFIFSWFIPILSALSVPSLLRFREGLGRFFRSCRALVALLWRFFSIFNAS